MTRKWLRCNYRSLTRPLRRNRSRKTITTAYPCEPFTRIIPCTRPWFRASRIYRVAQTTAAGIRLRRRRAENRSGLDPIGRACIRLSNFLRQHRPGLRRQKSRVARKAPRARDKRRHIALVPLRHQRKGKSRTRNTLMRDVSHTSNVGWNGCEGCTGKFPIRARRRANRKQLHGRTIAAF